MYITTIDGTRESTSKRRTISLSILLCKSTETKGRKGKQRAARAANFLALSVSFWNLDTILVGERKRMTQQECGSVELARFLNHCLPPAWILLLVLLERERERELQKNESNSIERAYWKLIEASSIGVVSFPNKKHAPSKKCATKCILLRILLVTLRRRPSSKLVGKSVNVDFT
jgi:hypothetical protein